MSFASETYQPFGVIEPEDTNRPPEEARFSVQPLGDNIFLVKHPFHGPKKIGDNTDISDRYLDKAMATLLDHFSYLADSRKLNRVARYATRPYANEFSQLSHCVSLGLMGIEFAGGRLEVLDGCFNDSSHAYNGHQADDNYQGHGKEDSHDYIRPDFFKRSALVRRFVEGGVLKPNSQGYHLADTRMYLDTLLDEDEATVRMTFMSNKHESRRMDADRFQYNQEERFLKELYKNRHSKDPMKVPMALASLSLESIQRAIIQENGEGDQLIYTEIDPAVYDAIAYGEFNAMHWCEPVQDAVNDVLNLAERYFFVCDDELARDYQYFYPRDYLHTSATYMFELFHSVARRDPFMHFLLDTAARLAADQKAKMSEIIDEKKDYAGPDPTDDVVLRRLEVDEITGDFKVEGNQIIATLPKGKMRKVDPRVSTGNHKTAPLSELRPEVFDYIKHLHRWIGNYEARITIDDPDTLQVVKNGIEQVRNDWPSALRRTAMPDREFERNIQRANAYVRAGK